MLSTTKRDTIESPSVIVTRRSWLSLHPTTENITSVLCLSDFAMLPHSMHIFKQEWTELFRSRHPDDPSHLGDCIIIDDILLWSTIISSLLLLFDCVCDVFLKYRVTFQLKKCEFLTDRIEYVGHDITSSGNCPAESKFDLIKDWPLQLNGPSLGSFIGLLTFYNIYCPFFEIRVKPLCLLERQHHRKPIPADL
jgi:hypothetical protein